MTRKQKTQNSVAFKAPNRTFAKRIKTYKVTGITDENGAITPFGDGLSFTIRSITNRDVLFIGPNITNDKGETDSALNLYWLVRFGVTGWSGLRFEDEDTELEPSYEDVEVLGKTVRILSDESFDLRLNSSLFSDGVADQYLS